MSTTFLSSASASVTALTSGAVSLSATVAIGDLVVVTMAFTATGAVAGSTVTDSLSTSYSLVRRNAGGSLTCAYEVWWGIASAGATNPTVTAMWGSAANAVVTAAVFRSTGGVWSLSTSSSFTTTPASTTQHCAAVGAIDVAAAESVLVGGGAATSTSFSPVAASGFTLISVAPSSRCAMQYKISTAPETDQRGSYTSANLTANNALAAFVNTSPAVVTAQAYVWGPV